MNSLLEQREVPCRDYAVPGGPRLTVLANRVVWL